jgi:nucleotide-binding universal stress UspA family protein
MPLHLGLVQCSDVAQEGTLEWLEPFGVVPRDLLADIGGAHSNQSIVMQHALEQRSQELRIAQHLARHFIRSADRPAVASSRLIQQCSRPIRQCSFRPRFIFDRRLFAEFWCRTDISVIVSVATLENAMFRHILIPTDLSGRSGEAVDMARDLAKAARARITLFHVIETVSGADFDEFASFYKEIEERASAHLTALASRFQDPRLDVVKTVKYGKPAEEIVRVAVEQEVDLIVLASHRIDLSRAGYGWSTLSYKVGVLAPCPVLLVK